jgi:hypothetical protein
MTTYAEPRQLSLLPDPIDARFLEFHHANPHVYEGLVSLARQWKEAGNDRCSMDMLFHLLRWRYGLITAGDQFTLNNNFTSRYARLIQANERDLCGMFATRALRGDEA